MLPVPPAAPGERCRRHATPGRGGLSPPVLLPRRVQDLPRRLVARHRLRAFRFGLAASGWLHPFDQCRQSERTHQSARFVTGHRAGIAARIGAPARSRRCRGLGGVHPRGRFASAEPSEPVFPRQCAESRRMRRIDSASAAASQRRVLEPLGGSPGRTAAVGHQPRRAIPRRAYRSALVSSPSCREASASCSARCQRSWGRLRSVGP